MSSGQIMELASIIVFFIGFYGLISGKNIIKSIVAIGIMEAAVVVFFLSFGFSEGIMPPIGSGLTNVADPLPQSLVITAIVMGVAVTAINLTMLNTLLKQSKTTDWDKVKKMNME